MAVFKWVGGGVASLDQGSYDSAADWLDVTTGTIGVIMPQAGDTVVVVGVHDTGIGRLGALFTFPVGDGYVQISAFLPQSGAMLQNDPNGLVGSVVQGQTIGLDGRAGAISLWLQNSQLLGDAIGVTGTVVISAYLDDTISGSVIVGGAAGAGFLQVELIPFDTGGVGPSGAFPVSTLDAAIAVGAGSTFEVEAATGGSVVGLVNNGTIAVGPGGTLVFDDTDNAQVASFTGLLDTVGEHSSLLGNGGTIEVLGAAGQTTRAVFLMDTVGPGAIVVAGQGAPRTATTVTVDGYMTDQTIAVADATVTFNDTYSDVDALSDPGFAITGGAFIFADAQGTLVLHQAPLTQLEFNANDTDQIEVPDGRHPFTTPVYGFATGDTIALPGKYLGAYGATYYTAYDAATGVLDIDSPASLAGDPPAVLASLNLVGAYDPTLFRLAGNKSTEELDLTYMGVPGTPILPPAPTLAYAGIAARSEVTDSPTLTLTGTAPAGSTVALLAGSVAIGSAVAGGTGQWSATVGTPLSAGPEALTASIYAQGTVVGSSSLTLVGLPAPANGVTTPDEGSYDITTELAGGGAMPLVPGTEAMQLVDGIWSFGPDTGEATVQRLYEGLLGRAADPAGLATFSSLLNGGATPSSVAGDLIGSAEFAAMHGTPAAMTDTQFVTLLYSGLLGRAPDAGGLQGWTAALAHGTTRADAAADFAQSPESKAHFAGQTADLWAPDATGALVTELYETAFGHVPDIAGLNAWSGSLRGGLTAAQFAQDIVGSAEFQALHAGQDTGRLVTSFYADGLGRAPDAAGLQAWSAVVLSQGAATVLQSFATSAEAASHLAPPL